MATKKWKIICLILSIILIIEIFIFCFSKYWKQLNKVEETSQLWENDTTIYNEYMYWAHNYNKLNYIECEENIKQLTDQYNYTRWNPIYMTYSSGKAQLVFRIISIDAKTYKYAKLGYPRDLSNYTWILTHESLHLKYFSSNEKWVEYMTFVTLYESDISYFKYVALDNAIDILNGTRYSQYDCSLNILKYFEDKGK